MWACLNGSIRFVICIDFQIIQRTIKINFNYYEFIVYPTNVKFNKIIA